MFAALNLRDTLGHAPRSLWRRGHGCSPLHLAVINGCLDVVQLLVGAGADVSMQDRYRARHLRSRMAVQPHALCRNGSNVLAVALQCEHDACAQYFNKRCRCARQRIDHSESLFYSTELHGLGTLGADLALDNDL